MNKIFFLSFRILFLLIILGYCSLSKANAVPALGTPDLDLQFISMAPLHSVNSCKAAFHRRETVLLTAMVCNCGNADARDWNYEWLIDGKRVSTGKYGNTLHPGQSISIRRQWRWEPGRHYVQFLADPSHSIQEISYVNNSLRISTDAWSMLWIMSKNAYDAFKSQANLPDCGSLVDWAQGRLQRMNRLMQTSPKPKQFSHSLAPTIRCDKIILSPDPRRTYKDLYRDSHGAILHDFDAIWIFGNTKKGTASIPSSDKNIYLQWMHAEGVIPGNAFDRHSYDNFALDRDRIPLLISHRDTLGNMQLNDASHSSFPTDVMGAMYTLFTKNTHYPDAYLYCIPRICRIRVLDAMGKPVEGARLTFWLDRHEMYSPEPSFSGRTNGSGEFTLPNRSVPATIRRKYHTGKGNPFGVISPGTNSVMLISIAARDQTEYRWLDIPQLNCAYWEGNRNSAIFTFHTHIPPIHALPAPSGLSGSNERNKIFLHWKQVRGATAYHLYRATTSECRYQSCALIHGSTSWEGVFGKEPMDRFVVTAVSSNGVESAFSNTLRMVQMKDPWGMTIGRNGWRYIKDAGWDRILVQDRYGAWIGLMGSSQGLLRGSYGIAPYLNGELLVALCGNRANPRAGFAILSSRCKVLMIHCELQGNSPGEFNSPMGIASNAKGDIFVADTNNGRVQEFNAKGKLVRIIGAKELHNPMSVSFDGKGGLYVVDFYTNKIDVFTPKRNGGYRLTNKLEGVDEPVYATVDRFGRVFAASHRYAAIHMFNKHGADVWVWYGTKRDHLSGPRAIAITKNGYALVVDNALQKILKVKIPSPGMKLKPVEEIEKDDDD